MGAGDRFSCCFNFGGVDFEEDGALASRPVGIRFGQPVQCREYKTFSALLNIRMN
jgi:hypothetical protein